MSPNASVRAATPRAWTPPDLLSLAALPVAVAATLAAVESYDTELLLTGFAEEAAVNAWGVLFTGPDGIRFWSENWIRAQRVRFTDRVCLRERGHVAVHVQVHSERLNGPATLTFRLDDALIRTLDIAA